MNRRSLLTGLIAAPLVVRTPCILMPIRPWRSSPENHFIIVADWPKPGSDIYANVGAGGVANLIENAERKMKRSLIPSEQAFLRSLVT